MDENKTELFNAAIVENGIIVNILVFDNEATMRDFGALPIADGQGIGDEYMTPEEYTEKQTRERMMNYVEDIVESV